ncbi:MAG: endolytic transglycosylase MltG [Desulfovibrio sp.]|nr:endolytic transglycosylase MltG [Desulfovibrio sp.]
MVFSLLILLLMTGAGLWYTAYTFLHTVPETEGRTLSFDVLPGATFRQVSARLADAGLVTNARYFFWLARLTHHGQTLKAGRFALSTGWEPEKILHELLFGKPVLYRITIPEGLTYWQTAELLAEKGFVERDVFEKVVQDPNFLKNYGIPFSTAEGFLMPDTYLLKKEELQDPEKKQKQAWKIAARLVETFFVKAEPFWPKKTRPSKEDLQRYVILASIVEKETAIPQERARVAGVYSNRLQRKMLLQADPTVIYGLGKTFTGRLLYRHLNDVNNPYNTYQKPGLPPGPICSFGIEALRAAIVPEQHDFIYFVAKTDGGAHTFSTTLANHNRAVEEYRKQKRQP